LSYVSKSDHKTMFNLFGSKSKKEKLEKRYLELTQQAYELDQYDTKAAAEVRRKAQMIMHKLVLIGKTQESYH
jgi:hypothetical protein